MSDLRKKKNKNKKVRDLAILNSATELSVLKMNRMVSIIIIGLMLAVIYMGYLLMPANDLSEKKIQVHRSVALYEVPMNPVVSAEVDALKSQLVGLVSGSIESKLKILEEGLRQGSDAQAGLATIQALKEDLVVLKTYSKTGAGRLIAETYSPELVTEGKVLAAEVSHLRSLVHFLLGSCGLMLAAVAGVWIRKCYALTSDAHEQKKIL